MSKTEIDEPTQFRAKECIDVMFDNDLLNPKMTRDDMKGIEDYIALVLQQNINSTAKCTEIILDMKKTRSVR